VVGSDGSFVAFSDGGVARNKARGAIFLTENGADLVLVAMKTLHENGNDTSSTLEAAERLTKRLGIEARVVPEWGELFLSIDRFLLRAIEAVPGNINMNRVVATLRVVDAIKQGSLAAPEAAAALNEAARALPSNALVFAAACGFGAAALSIINGATHYAVLAIIALCAAAGGLLRRAIAALTPNPLMQIFAASLLAGAVGAAGVWAHLSSSLRLIALGPLLVLIPGPAILGGFFDLASVRVPLGVSRLGFGMSSVFAITAGVLIGLDIGSQTLPPLVISHSPPLWVDVLCAGIAVAAYGIFFSIPAQMLAYPVVIGMAAHAVRYWTVSHFGLDNASATGLACLFVGIVMVPIARRMQLPFAAVGFASVVSMVPGIFLIRLGGGLLEITKSIPHSFQPALNGVVADGATAVLTVVAMCLGLVLPKSLYDYLAHRSLPCS
jgi:uncharacterized membrane protein YjjP (DUF1212 family)